MTTPVTGTMTFNPETGEYQLALTGKTQPFIKEVIKEVPALPVAPAPVALPVDPTLPPTGYAGPHNTGVPAAKRTTLRAGSAVTVTTAGTVIDGMDISNGLRIQAPCTIRNTRVRGRNDGTSTVMVSHGVHGVLFEDVEVDATRLADGTEASTALYCRDSNQVTLRRVNMHGSSDGLVWGGVDFLAEDVWIHALDRKGDLHPDCAQTYTGGVVNSIIRRCSFQAYNFVTKDPHNACIMFGTTLAPGMKGILVEGNYFDGGNVSLNMRTDSREVSGVVFRRNRFGPNSRYGKAGIGLMRTGVTWDAATNVWHATGKPVPLPV